MPQITVFPIHKQNGTTAMSMMSPGALLRDQNNNELVLGSAYQPVGPAAYFAIKGFDANQSVGATQFQVGQLLEWMAQRAEPSWMRVVNSRTLVDVAVKQIAGIGFLSYIYRVEFYFDGRPTPYSVILKVPSTINLSVFTKSDAFVANWAYKLFVRHNKEIFCYENFGSAIAAAGIVHIPKLFHAVPVESPIQLERGCLLIEDLDQSAIMGNTVQGLSQLQVESMIRVLAKMHALSLALPGSQEMLDTLSFQFSLDEEDGQAKFNAVRALIATGHDYWARHGPLLERIAQQHELMQLDVHKRFGAPAVMCHGDFWTNNVFFERQPDGTMGEELFALIDFQFSHPNSGLQDIARFMLLCVNSPLKLRFLDDWLVLYHDTFAQACRTWGLSSCPYTMNMVRQMFLAHYPSEMLFSIVILMNYYSRVEDPGMKTALLGRMISSFEWLRQKMKAQGQC